MSGALYAAKMARDDIIRRERERQKTERTWYFTVERDIPIQATSEEEAERKFREKYGGIPILGIVRPLHRKVNKDG